MIFRWRPRSVRAYLLAWIIVPIALFIVVDSVALYRNALESANTAYDRMLVTTAYSIGDALRIEDRWLVDGTHYQRTADHWLANQDVHRGEVMAILREAYGAAAPLWFQRWRMFWMACAELFGYDHGREWMVAHYRFTKEAT